MQIDTRFSDNQKINLLIQNILEQLCPFLEEQARQISDLTAIGKALGNGDDITAVLEMILSIARRFTHADGGTLYLVTPDEQHLKFHVIHNASLNLQKSGSAIDLPIVDLYNADTTPNLSNVSSYAYHTENIINIKDVYHTKKFDFKKTKSFDTTFGYKSKSMIVIPMRNHEDDIIGILQLINSIDETTGKIVPFSLDAQEKVDALASQASVMLTQHMLIVEMKALFEAFIEAIAVSIDEKSKHTGGHIQRVTELCLMIARKINEDQETFKDIQLSDDQLNELRIAALMHDTGKITTPDHIINKSTRLETITDRFELIQARWELLKTNLELKAAKEKLTLFNDPGTKNQIKKIDRKCQTESRRLDQQLNALHAINICKTGLNQADLSFLDSIKEKTETVLGKTVPYLTPGEFENLTIQNGTLTSHERNIVNSHADVSEKILSKLPWPKKLANIPSIAGAHHEKLDGTGYPLHLDKTHLNLQARILGICDIFEALSARDRPYKKAMPLSKTKTILEQMGQKGLLDNDVISLLFSSNLHLEYAEKHLSKNQIDL